MAKNIGIVFAGGIGSRMEIKDIPKQFLKVNGKSIIIHTLEYFDNHPEIDDIYISCVGEWIPYLNKQLAAHNITKVRAVVEGGATGQDSIYNALIKAREENDSDSVVLIHDGVRPYITEKLISDNIKSVKKNGTAITTTPCFETILISQDGVNIDEVPFRKDTYAAQAPQSFYLDELLDAHEEMRKQNPAYENVIDSCTLYRMLGRTVHMIEGNRGNLKITTIQDYFIFKGLLESINCQNEMEEQLDNVQELIEEDNSDE